MAKDGILRVRVPKSDLVSWERRAEESGMRFPSWVIMELNRFGTRVVASDEIFSTGRVRVRAKRGKVIFPAGDVVVLGEIPVIKSAADIPAAVAKCTALAKCTAARERAAKTLPGKVDAEKTERVKSAPRLAKNGKMYTGETAVQFGLQAWEIIVDERRSWVFEKPEFEGGK